MSLAQLRFFSGQFQMFSLLMWRLKIQLAQKWKNEMCLRPCKEAEKGVIFPSRESATNDEREKRPRKAREREKSSYPANSSLHSFLNSFPLFSLSHWRVRICPTKQSISAQLICYKAVRFLSDFLVWSRRSWQKTHFWHHCLTQISKDARTRKRKGGGGEMEKVINWARDINRLRSSRASFSPRSSSQISTQERNETSSFLFLEAK